MPALPSAGPFDIARLDLMRRASECAVVWLIWLHAPLAMLSGKLAASSFLIGVAVWAVVTVVTLLMMPSRPATVRPGSASVAALCALAALIVLEVTGPAWQSDAFLAFFALLGIAAALHDYRAVFVAAALVAIHNVALQHVLPAQELSLPHDPWHPIVQLFEAIAATWLFRRAIRAIIAADAASGALRTPWVRLPKLWPFLRPGFLTRRRLAGPSVGH